jgi:hypothetical protein
MAPTQSQSGISTSTPHVAASKTLREPHNEPTSTLLPPTPLPTIPTSTPTFDVSTIVTVTPAPNAECPKEISSIKPNFNFDDKSTDVVQEIVKFLNNGGSLESLKSELGKNNEQGTAYGSINGNDLTNDGIPELILQLSGSVFIFQCQAHKYEYIFSDFPELEALFGAVEVTFLDDLNKNSIPEILVSKNTCGDALCNEVKIFEWNGLSFKGVLKRFVDNSENSTDSTFEDEITIADFDGNGVQDIIGTTEIPGNPDTFIDCIPCRVSHTIYSWNGDNFVESLLYYSPATYRFQEIQDADHESLYGNFSKSLLLYQQVVFNKQLQPWSPAIAQNMRENFLASHGGDLTPTPIVVELTEYPRLAAYAYFRIMLLHLMQGHESDAGAVYKTMLQKFSNDPNGRSYVEMATAFWDAYQSTHKMYDGCAAAIQYAAEHPEILTSLGSDYHGSQSHTYVPADVCPFR